MKKPILFWLLLAALLFVLPGLASAQCPGIEQFSGIRPVGHQQLTVSSTAVALTLPTGVFTVRMAVVHVGGDAIRTRDDGTAPTASVGSPWAVATKFIVCPASLTALRAIRQTTDATLDIDYYGN